MRQERTTIQVDSDIAQFLQTQFADWQAHANDLLRFFMDTSQTKEREFEPDAWEPGEMAEPPKPGFGL